MFYVIEILKEKLNISSEKINKFASLREAQSYFYKQYGTALGDDSHIDYLIMLMDNTGTIYNVEHFENENNSL